MASMPHILPKNPVETILSNTMRKYLDYAIKKNLERLMGSKQHEMEIVIKILMPGIPESMAGKRNPEMHYGGFAV